MRNAYTVKLRNMESRPRTMRVTLEGLPGALMWTDTMPREDAAREVVETVAADATGALRVYVVAPPGTKAQDFSFAVATRGEKPETDASDAVFAAPEE